MDSPKRKPKWKRVSGKKIEWDFNPTLGHTIEPTITRKEFDEILTRLSGQKKEQTDQEKK